MSAFSLPSIANAPLFSFVIPVYDRQRVVHECIRNCLNQTFENFEIIVVADGSPPATLDVIESYRDDPRVRIFRYADAFGTACRARNRGILEARGEYICFLDSDDFCSVKRLEHVKAVLDVFSGEKPDVVYGSVCFLPEKDRHIEGIDFGDIGRPAPGGFSLEQLIEANQIYTLTASVRRSALLKYGGFRTGMRYREDYELWLRLCFNGARFTYTNEVLAYYRIHGGNNELNFKDNDAIYYQQAIDQYQQPFMDWGC